MSPSRLSQAPNHALQRTAPRVTLAAAHHPAACAHPAPTAFPQPARRAPPSLSLGSLAQSTSAMHPSFLKLLCAAFALISAGTVRSEDLEALSKSSVWQVRYCVAIKFDSPTPTARASLERLCQDEVRQVAQHAFSAYSRTFVALDREIVRTAFSRGDFDLVGFTVTDRKVFETPDFWIHDLDSSPDDSIRGRAVRAIGMCGVAANIAKLSGYKGSHNSYLLIELALAFHRLGDTEKYLAALNAILALPIADAFYYQTAAIDCLLQTHPDRATPAWKRVHQQFEGSRDLQPGWVYSHIIQEGRLP